MAATNIFNKREAFRKCVESKQFMAWHKIETLRRLGKLKDIDRELENEENIRIEYYDPS